MQWLKTNFPILFSPTFWGLTLSAFFQMVELYQWMSPELANILTTWLIGITGVNILWKTANKVSGK